MYVIVQYGTFPSPEISNPDEDAVLAKAQCGLEGTPPALRALFVPGPAWLISARSVSRLRHWSRAPDIRHQQPPPRGLCSSTLTSRQIISKELRSPRTQLRRAEHPSHAIAGRDLHKWCQTDTNATPATEDPCWGLGKTQDTTSLQDEKPLADEPSFVFWENDQCRRPDGPISTDQSAMDSLFRMHHGSLAPHQI